MLYARAPVGMHAVNVASTVMLGDTPLAIRVPWVIFGCLSAFALMLVTWRFFSPPHAFLTGLVYVLLPVNAVFVNMPNHDTGFIAFWALALLWYRRSWSQEPKPDLRALSLCVLFTFLAIHWSWTGYYAALVLCTHWAWRAFIPRIRRRAQDVFRFRVLSQRIAWLLVYGLFVTANIGLFFLWAKHELGGDLWTVTSSMEIRSASKHTDWSVLWKNNSGMFTELALWAAPLWFAFWIWRLIRGRARDVHLLPITFAVAGSAYVLTFRQAAVVHDYMGWSSAPFFAFAIADITVTLFYGIDRLLQRGFLARRWLVPIVASIAVTAPITLYAKQAIPIAANRKPKAGSKSRGYNPGFDKVALAYELRRRSSPLTGVIFDYAFGKKQPIQMMAILDRERRRAIAGERYDVAPSIPDHLDGWTRVGVTSRTPLKKRIKAAANFHYTQFGDYFIIDYTKPGARIDAFRLRTESRNDLLAFLTSRTYPMLVPEEDGYARRSLEEELRKYLESRASEGDSQPSVPAKPSLRSTIGPDPTGVAAPPANLFDSVPIFPPGTRKLAAP